MKQQSPAGTMAEAPGRAVFHDRHYRSARSELVENGEAIDGSVGATYKIPKTINIKPYSAKLQRVIDLCLVLGSAPVWVPLCALIAMAVKFTSKGGCFFSQERRGLHGRAIRVLKFRSMRENSEDLIDDLIRNDEELLREWMISRKLRNDPRVTPLGKLLRATSLDELPQFINVLRGEMSLVGPRPLPHYHLEGVPAFFVQARERVKPGLTGYWQVQERTGELQTVIDCDLEYLRRRGPVFDFWVMLLTIKVVLLRTGY